MIQLHEQYLVDDKGNWKAVLVPISEWKQILDALEELDDIRAFDEAKSLPSDAIPFEQAVAQIREGMTDWNTSCSWRWSP
jgi:hypothetical protein